MLWWQSFARMPQHLVLGALIEGFMAGPCCQLHLESFGQIAIVVGAFYLVGVPHIAIVVLPGSRQLVRMLLKFLRSIQAPDGLLGFI